MWSTAAAMKSEALKEPSHSSEKTGEPEKRGRKASKETRRQQLIEATIDSLAKRGYSETTMADVADGAGLSRGIVNFHFESKESCSSRRCNIWPMNIRRIGAPPC